MSGDEHRKPIRLATEAYHAALAKDWPKVERTLNRLTRECDSEGIASALIAWCDTFIHHATGGARDGRKVRIIPWSTDTGKLNEPDAPESTKWATRLITARAAMDLDAFQAALTELNALPDGPPDFERGRHVAALLESLAMTVNALPQGYSSMGRPS